VFILFVKLLDCSVRFESFFSRTSVEKQISSPQAAGLSLKLQQNWQIQDEAPADLVFRWIAPGLCGPKGFKLEAPGKKAN